MADNKRSCSVEKKADGKYDVTCTGTGSKNGSKNGNGAGSGNPLVKNTPLETLATLPPVPTSMVQASSDPAVVASPALAAPSPQQGASPPSEAEQQNKNIQARLAVLKSKGGRRTKRVTRAKRTKRVHSARKRGKRTHRKRMHRK